MSFTLIAPGRRKNNPYWLARGQHPVTGRSVEISTKTRDKTAARRFAQEIWIGLAKSSPPRPGEAISFERMARLYAEFKDLDLDEPKANPGRTRDEAIRLTRLISIIGGDMISDIGQARIVEVANHLCPGLSPATKNRDVVTPIAAVLHYAAECEYRPWLRVRRFREAQPETRAVTMDVAASLISAASEGPQQLLLLWLFRHGTRITQTLGIKWSDVSLIQQTFRLYDKKARRWQLFPLHAEVFEILAAIPENERTGSLWPWSNKASIYHWTGPLASKLGIKFTPHMARHSLGTWLNAQGEGLKTIMATLGHSNPKSSVRYQAADVELVRAAGKRVGDLKKVGNG
jgi:integrase